MSQRNPNNITKHQHFVPQSYLKHWCDINGRLHVHRISSQTDFVTNKRNVAGLNYAYDTALTLDPSKPEHFQYFERLFSTIEADGAQLFSKIHEIVRRSASSIYLPSTYLQIPRQDVNELIRFMVIQFLRGMLTRKRMTERMNVWCKRIWMETAPILFPGNYSEAEFDEVSEDWLKHYQMEFMATRIEKFSAAIEPKTAVFGLVKGTEKLYTGDDPVHWTGYMVDPTIMWDGLLSPTCRIVYPLAPDICAIFYDQNYYEDQKEFNCSSRILSPGEIQEFNHHLVLQSYTEVYSSDGNFDTAKFTLAQKKISGETWHGSKEPDTELEELVELLKEAAYKTPPGIYSKERWLSVVQQQTNLPFGKL